MRGAFWGATRTSRHVIVRTPGAGRNAASRGTLDPQQRVLVLLESFVSVAGLGGGSYMVAHPLTIMPLRFLEGTWFHTWRWPGVALLVFVGVGPALAVMATLQRRRRESLGHVVVGTGLIAWIVIEAAWVVVAPGWQIAFAAIGVTIVVLAVSDAPRRKERRDAELTSE
ncbi:MAG: hypothetical protein HIU57_06460 [Acidobacteria bacterium]|nr:hypothetical protein [Acidobacteriota bacterium]